MLFNADGKGSCSLNCDILARCFLEWIFDQTFWSLVYMVGVHCHLLWLCETAVFILKCYLNWTLAVIVHIISWLCLIAGLIFWEMCLLLLKSRLDWCHLMWVWFENMAACRLQMTVAQKLQKNCLILKGSFMLRHQS